MKPLTIDALAAFEAEASEIEDDDPDGCLAEDHQQGGERLGDNEDDEESDGLEEDRLI